MEIEYYEKKMKQPMIKWEPNIDMSKVSISEFDLKNGSPKDGDMIAFNPEDSSDQWLVAKEFLIKNYEKV